jgi:hypothetical protein
LPKAIASTSTPQPETLPPPRMSKAFPFPPTSSSPLAALSRAPEDPSHTERPAANRAPATHRTRAFRAHTLPPLSLPPAERRRPPPQPTEVPGAPTQPAATTPNQKVGEPRKARAGCEIENNAFRPHVLAHDRLRVWSSPFSIERAHFLRKTTCRRHQQNLRYAPGFLRARYPR